MKNIIKIALLGFIVSSCSHLKVFTKKEKHPLENKYTYKKLSAKDYHKQGLIPLQDFF